MYTCIYAYIHTYSYMNMNMYIYMYICICRFIFCGLSSYSLDTREHTFMTQVFLVDSANHPLVELLQLIGA